MIVRDQRPKMDDAIFVERDLVELRDARDIDQCFDAFADAAFKFKDEVGGSCYNACVFPVFSKSVECFFNGCCGTCEVSP